MYEINTLDTNRFCIKIANMNVFDLPLAELKPMLLKDKVRLVISRIKGEDIQLLNQLEEIGFRVMDTQLKYKYLLFPENLKSRTKSKNNVQVRPFINTDLPVVLEIASKSFNGHGHYYADLKLDRGKVSEIYRDWIKRSCLNKSVADLVLIGTVNQKVAGFLSFKIYKKEGKSFAAGGLGAVDSQFRGLNVFRSIVYEGLQWGMENSLAWEEHNVLISNYPVNGSFISEGFKITDSYYTLHFWVE